MQSCNSPELVISAVGVTSAIGQGKTDFSGALLAGRHAFGPLRRSGRSVGDAVFIGAEIAELRLPERLTQRAVRTASLSGQVAAATLAEAWGEARLDEVDAERISLVVGGSNLQQRELVQVFDTYRDRSRYVRPSYASSYLDSDLCGLCTELFSIKGAAWTVGAASASGQVAVIQAAQSVLSGASDVCIALGALSDLSYWECQAMRSAGAMGSDRFADEPARACRPFDRAHDGFIYGESCAVLVIETATHAARRGVVPYAAIAGWGYVVDGRRGTEPSPAGELRAIQAALRSSGVGPADIDYVNPHGTGSVLGDEVELAALRDAGLVDVRINATKALTGHGLTAAGAVEVAACLLQMRGGQLHPTRNLDEPLDARLGWVGERAQPHTIRHCLNLSMGFGGINTALCLRHL